MDGLDGIELRLDRNCADASFLKKAWKWIFGIDLQAADEEIEEAFEPAFMSENERHRSEMSRIDAMFKEAEQEGGAAERFDKWRQWWQEGAKEFERHESKIDWLAEAKARIHLLAYVKSQPFFIRPMLGGAIERTSGDKKK